MSVLTMAGAFAGKSVELDNINFTFKRTETRSLWAARSGDVATLSTRICYTIHSREPGGKLVTRSPFDVFGRLHRASRLHLMRYLEASTGLTGLVGGACELGIVVPDFLHESEKQRKVWFNGVADLTLLARVGDASVFNRLAGVAIGKRRSYGFGSISCDDLEVDAHGDWIPESDVIEA